MTRIAICNPSIEPGDAVSNDMMGMHAALSELGHEVYLYSLQSSIKAPYIKPIEKMNSFLKSTEDLLIYHYATGWGFGLKLLEDLRCRKVIKFHNVTPPEFYEGVNSDYVSVCKAGRQQMKELARIPIDLYLPCSEYSRRDLMSAGIDGEKCRVVPPFHNIDRLQGINADLKEIERYDDGVINIVMVSRLAPNKNHHALIEAFAIYRKRYNPNSRLLIVGGTDSKLKSYTSHLRNRVRELHLEDRIIFTGKASDPVLKAYYLVAHIFMMTSLHEGFCVPLVEAMSMKIPIVAYGSTAVPETLGKAGLVWGELDPELLAASVHKIVREEYLQVALGEMGWYRYHHLFTNLKIKALFLDALKDIL